MKPMLFHWMSLALKLNFLTNNGSAVNVNYNNDELLKEIIIKNLPYSSWPELITSKLEELKITS
jgi:hypothetical protein